MQPVPAASTYSGVLAKQTPVLWRGIQPVLAPAFAGKPYILDQMVTGAFFKTHVRAQALLSNGNLDGEILIKRNADVVSLADHVLFAVIQKIANHTLDICNCSRDLAPRINRPLDRLDGIESSARVGRDRDGKILSMSFPNATRERLPVLKAMLLSSGKVQQESDFENILFYFGSEQDESNADLEKKLTEWNQDLVARVRSLRTGQYFTLEADKVPALFLSRCKIAPQVRESDHKLVYAIECSELGHSIAAQVDEVRSEKYFIEGMSHSRINPAHLQNVKEDFAKVVTLVRNLVKNVPQCSLYVQDTIHSLEIFTRKNSPGMACNFEEDAILFLASKIFFQEDLVGCGREGEMEMQNSLATQCLNCRRMDFGESIINMRQTLQRFTNRNLGLIQLMTKLNDGIAVPDVL